MSANVRNFLILEMKPAAFIRNMSVHQMWKDYRAEDLCLPFKKVNHIGTDLDMIIKTAKKANSEHLEKLKELKSVLRIADAF